MTRTYEVPKILWKNSGMRKYYTDDAGNQYTYGICLSFGNMRVWIHSVIYEGTPVLEFSEFDMDNPPRMKNDESTKA